MVLLFFQNSSTGDVVFPNNSALEQTDAGNTESMEKVCAQEVAGLVVIMENGMFWMQDGRC